MIYVKVNDRLFPASIQGRTADYEWDGRHSKAITLDEPYEAVNALFPDGAAWSIVTEEEEFDNSDFCIRGDLTVHTGGKCTVKMGKPTDLEIAYEMLFGGM